MFGDGTPASRIAIEPIGDPAQRLAALHDMSPGVIGGLKADLVDLFFQSAKLAHSNDSVARSGTPSRLKSVKRWRTLLYHAFEAIGAILRRPAVR